MLTTIVQLAIAAVIVLSFWLIRREVKLDRKAAEEARLSAYQTYTACKARVAGEEAKRVGTIIYLNSVGLADMDKNSARGVPPRLDYLRTPAEMRAIRQRIISESSISIAECRERQRIQGRN